MQILVTGGTGFIGAAAVRRLVASGHDVVALDNNWRGSERRLGDVLAKVRLVTGDVRDKATVAAAAEGCDALFHLAFVNGTRYFYEIPDVVLDIGVKGALNTVEVAREHGIGTYVLASSSEVYQTPAVVPTPEDAPAVIPDVLNPRYSYAGGKLISELLTINHFRNAPTRAVIFRPHNVFGPDMGNEHIIPEIVAKIRRVAGEAHPDSVAIDIQGDGTETRAFCFIEDAVDQIMAVFERGKDGEIYHIGMDDERPIRQLIDDIGACLNIRIDCRPGPLRAGGTPRRCPSIEKVKRLGYARNNRYEPGLRETVDWYWANAPLTAEKTS